MKINVISVGSLKNDLQKIYDSYAKKISFFAKINLIEIKESNEKNIQQKITFETTKILEKIPHNSRVILCSLQGKQISSDEFANFTEIDNITFVIGGSNGVDEKLFKEKINFSKMTFPHQLFRIMLIEQIYRGFTIKKNIKYHK
ncbi:23S rRNA (pseudouridine(1915)-N(3))-methyltransferase RlmH [Mycoplasma iguanae]|uniref:Ribosomal RNA large subunit methyltransferase H n=1 Tax=Mycoplasma iguanae TaxID=292461 RepID=A0ABY5RAG5_9MOLU|nr:23S rRNA (pseudouridine(1915)-N(3))-methyltransferase RlmH [Mycoplasma iguanae]UVD81980.1 23S rRNA (pseudouridine(1915)-N(3))-methyltransferase RlmH [Mycoplasma iguanae]